MSQHRTKSEPSASRPNHERRRAAFLKDRLSPRTRDLFLDLMSRHGPGSLWVESQCLKLAELTASAENLRARLATEEPSPALINSVTRLESTARRAAVDLAKLSPPKADDPASAFAEAWRLDQEAQRIEELDREQNGKDAQR